MKHFRHAGLLVGLAVLTSCGGGGQSAEEQRRLRQEELRSQAVSKEEEARVLGLETPCETDNQCGYLFFRDEKSLCDLSYAEGDLKTYSKVAPSASQAEQAALAQQILVAEARMLEDPPAPCPAIALVPPPPPMCAANRCVGTLPPP